MHNKFAIIFILALFTATFAAPSCPGGAKPFIERTGRGENEIEARKNADRDIVSSLSKIEVAVFDTLGQQEEANSDIKEYTSYKRTIKMDGGLDLKYVEDSEYPYKENGQFVAKRHICPSKLARPYLDSLERYLENLEDFLEQKIDEDNCIIAKESKKNMRGWQSILEFLNQVDKTLQSKYENAYEEIKKRCGEIGKSQTIVVRKIGVEPKNSDVLKYIEGALVKDSLYSVISSQATTEIHKAKFECLVEITQNDFGYTLSAKIENADTRRVKKGPVSVKSNLKTPDEQKSAGMELVSKLLKRCGNMSIGDDYEGECKNGKKEGKGKYTYADIVYEGKILSKGKVYEGEFKNDVPNGKGKFIRPYASGGVDVYEGEFKDGEPNGKGKLTGVDGSIYEGEFKDGKPDGKGKFTLANGYVFHEGKFKDGKPDGKVKYTEKGHVCEWEDKTKKLKIIYANGNVYEGEADGMSLYFRGKGKLTYADGGVYEGEFSDGARYGRGKLTYKSGSVDEGEFRIFLEKGKRTYKDGAVYEGEFIDGVADGKGKYIHADGIVDEGEFDDFSLKKGKRTYADGSVFEAENGIYSSILIDTRDGKEYRTVAIGSQTWMAENLNYNASGSVCYEKNESYCWKYGRLYRWEKAKKEACPRNWHLPSEDEWEVLVNFAGGEKFAGKKLKAANGWDYDYENGSIGNGTDNYGFTALPGGLGYNYDVKGWFGYRTPGIFSNVGIFGSWWSSSHEKNNGGSGIYKGIRNDGYIGYGGYNSYDPLRSVRCVKD